jgi:LPXTG-motif cell wall-anchored protein
MGSTHTWGGVNYADAFNTAMTVIGIICLLIGAGIFISVKKVKVTASRPDTSPERSQRIAASNA